MRNEDRGRDKFTKPIWHYQFGIIGTDRELEEFVEYLQRHPLAIKLAAGFLVNYCDR